MFKALVLKYMKPLFYKNIKGCFLKQTKALSRENIKYLLFKNIKFISLKRAKLLFLKWMNDFVLKQSVSRKINIPSLSTIPYQFLWIGSFLLFSAALILFFPFPLHAQKQYREPFPITQYQLPNGLQVILSEDYSLPVVSVAVAYNVGSINEKPGKTGIAYMMENLMFLGSENVRKMQHVSLIHQTGGKLNASTTEDRTLFYQTVPSNHLELVLWLESDRMNSLDITSRKVEQSKQSLIEEIKQRKQRDPYLESELAFDKILYPDFVLNHPYFGNEIDLRNLTTKDVLDFYKIYYTPNNTVLCVTGHFNVMKTKDIIEKYFGDIPSGENLPELSIPESFESEHIEMSKESPLIPSPGFYMGYRTASIHSNDFYPLKIMEYLLLKGEGSRLYNKLIKKERMTLHISGGIEIRKNISTFKIFALSNNELLTRESQRAILSEINRIRSSILPGEELARAKNMFKMNYIKRYATSLNKALFLIDAFLYNGNFDHLKEELDKYLAVSNYDIMKVLNRYFIRKSIILHINMK